MQSRNRDHLTVFFARVQVIPFPAAIESRLGIAKKKQVSFVANIQKVLSINVVKTKGNMTNPLLDYKPGFKHF